LRLLDSPFIFNDWHQTLINRFDTAQYGFVKDLFDALAAQSDLSLSAITRLAGKNEVADDYKKTCNF
jgi:hypothetical protein